MVHKNYYLILSIVVRFKLPNTNEELPFVSVDGAIRDLVGCVSQ